MKNKTKLKPRRMWANYYPDGCPLAVYTRKKIARCVANEDATASAVPVAVIPLDDPKDLIRRAGDAFHDSYDGHICQSDIVAMLAAIGVLPKQRKGRK